MSGQNYLHLFMKICKKLLIIFPVSVYPTCKLWNGFSWKFVMGSYIKICQSIPSFG